MAAIDTIASFQTTVASTLAAGVMATGDPSSIRNCPPSSQPLLTQMFSDHVTTALPWRVRSPLLHDNVQGIKVYAGVTPSGPLLPYEFQQPLNPQDTLIFELSTAAATGKALGCAQIYYPQLPGVAARLYDAPTINPLIKNIKPMLVSVGSGANTAGQWFDVVCTTSENLLHANTDYAVLGILTDVAVAAIAVKGPDTGNLRIACPGVILPNVTANYFRDMSIGTGLPYIPVINSANINGTYLSIISAAATAAILNGVLILAELRQNLQ